EAVQRVRRSNRSFLMVGQRRDVEVREVLSFGPGWEGTLRARALQHGKSKGPTAIDYFVFRAGTWSSIPPFAIGRWVWDNWLIYGACMSGALVVDASLCVLAVHQNHDYRHFTGGLSALINS